MLCSAVVQSSALCFSRAGPSKSRNPSVLVGNRRKGGTQQSNSSTREKHPSMLLLAPRVQEVSAGPATHSRRSPTGQATSQVKQLRVQGKHDVGDSRSILDDEGLHRVIQGNQGQDGSSPWPQSFVHGQVLHLHQNSFMISYCICTLYVSWASTAHTP